MTSYVARGFKRIALANEFLKTLEASLTLYKGKDYFYFDAEKGTQPESIYCTRISDITIEDILGKIEEYREINHE